MKPKPLFLCLSAIFLMLLCGSQGFCDQKPTCAVLMFHPDAASAQMNEGQYLSDQYAELLGRLNLFQVIDRKAVSSRLQSKKVINLTEACATMDCALNLGQLLDVDYTVYGVIGHIGNLYTLETVLVNVKAGAEAQRAVTDFEGSQQDFAAFAPGENIKSLFGVPSIPGPPPTPAPPEETIETETVTPAAPEVVTTPPVQEPTEAVETKNLYFGPRVGVAASNDGVEVGGGFEVQFKRLSYQFLLNDDGFATGFSFYLHPDDSSPFVSLVGSYYDTKNHGVDEIGRIYGLLLGYRLNIMQGLNARAGVGAGYVNWDQTELPYGREEMDKDEEVIPLFEVTLGYMF